MGLRHFRGLTRTPRWIPTEEQVLRLFDAVSERYSRGVVARCRARLPDRRDPRPGGLAALHRLPWRRVHVVQQLRYDTAAYGGFLKEPKGGSAGTVSFDRRCSVPSKATWCCSVPPRWSWPTPPRTPARALHCAAAVHRLEGAAVPRSALGRALGAVARCRRLADSHGTFHALRHFCATTLLAHGVDPRQRGTTDPGPSATTDNIRHLDARGSAQLERAAPLGSPCPALQMLQAQHATPRRARTTLPQGLRRSRGNALTLTHR